MVHRDYTQKKGPVRKTATEGKKGMIIPEALTKKVLILFLIFLFYTPVYSYAQKTEKEAPFRPDGVILHSDRCSFFKSRNSEENILKNCHYYIRTDGAIRKGCDEKKSVLHILHRFNNRSLSVVIEGEFKKTNPAGIPVFSEMPAPQRESLKKLLYGLMERHNIPLSQIERHSEYERYPECPGYGMDYFGLMYEMAKEMISSAGKPLLEDLCKRRKIPLPLKSATLQVIKSQKTLHLYNGKVLIKSYSIGLSRKPKGDKEKTGDLRTPAGTFYITEKYPMRGWMELSYPGKVHADMALKKKTISPDQHRLITKTAGAGGISLHGTPMGDDVGIHAGGFPYGRMRTDSTAGCISMEDPEAFELYYAVPPGAKVVISE